MVNVENNDDDQVTEQQTDNETQSKPADEDQPVQETESETTNTTDDKPPIETAGSPVPPAWVKKRMSTSFNNESIKAVERVATAANKANPAIDNITKFVNHLVSEFESEKTDGTDNSQLIGEQKKQLTILGKQNSQLESKVSKRDKQLKKALEEINKLRGKQDAPKKGQPETIETEETDSNDEHFTDIFI